MKLSWRQNKNEYEVFFLIADEKLSIEILWEEENEIKLKKVMKNSEKFLKHKS